LPSLVVPTLVIVGALDEKYRAMGERMRRLLPRCQLGVIPQAGHAAHLEQPGPFLDAVTSFLLRDDAATARNYSVPEPLGQATH
jgi:pimeloyl-ACP methyl ester carboxylesterase